jgi:hypothetical protein
MTLNYNILGIKFHAQVTITNNIFPLPLLWMQNESICFRETTKRGPQVRGLPSWTWAVDYLRGPLSWTTLVDHSRGPLSWTTLVDHSRGPLSWTTLVDHSHGPLTRHQIFGVWVLDCACKNVLESSSVIIIIVETLHKIWSSKSIHYMTVLKYKCAITTLMQSFRIYALKIGSYFSRSLQEMQEKQ